MAKISRESLGYLGLDFQLRLIAQILTDRKFANNIIEIINPNYFDDEYLKIITATIKDAHEQDETIPDIGSLEFRLLETIKDDIKRTSTLSQLKKIKDVNLNDTEYVQKTGMNFCKRKELEKSVREITKIIEKGDLNDYDKCEEILKKALEHGDSKDDGIDVTDNIEEVLIDDFRNPIPTGISGLDEVMNGGLSKGELAVILAAFGVGKSTMMTKIASSGQNYGKNVLQIFFEDMPKVIQRKHLSCWSGIDLNNLNQHKELLRDIVIEKNNSEGRLKLKKFPSYGTTIPIIRQYIRKQIAQGFRPDIVLIDYMDCVTPSRKYDDVNVGEGSVMREAETLASEMDFALWTAIQGNRSAIKSEIVEADQIGGSIKKGQIGHFIVSIAKSLIQKENGTANMAILKSRFGKDGLVFNDIIFDNAKVHIEIKNDDGARTFLGIQKDKETNNQNRAAQIMQLVENRKKELSEKKHLELNQKANDAFNNKNFELAKSLYEEIVKLGVEIEEAKQRIIDINKIINND